MEQLGTVGRKTVEQRVGDDGPEGDAAAVAGTRRIILDLIRTAREYIRRPPAEQIITVSMALDFYGPVKVEVWAPAYYVARAMHAQEALLDELFGDPHISHHALQIPEQRTGPTREEVVEFAKKLPASTMLILDEAYVEMAPGDAVPAMDAFLDMPNVLRMRTFSKAYGLAGLRVGYAIGHPDTILMFDRVRNHFGMSRLSQKAAVAAISDDDWLEKVLNLISSSRQKIAKIVEAYGFTTIPSATNFVTIDCGRDGDYAREILKELMERGIFVRMPGVAPLDRCIRVSVGPDEEIDRFAAALNDIMSKQK